MIKLKILFTVLIILGYCSIQAQDLSNCKKTCKKTRIVLSGPLIGLRTLGLPDSQSVRVVEVVKNGASSKHGILLYDTLTHFNGKVIVSMNYFIGEVAKLQPGDTITLTVNRLGIVSNFVFPLGAASSKKVTEIVCCDEPEPEPTLAVEQSPKAEPVIEPTPIPEPTPALVVEPTPVAVPEPTPVPAIASEPTRETTPELDLAPNPDLNDIQFILTINPAHDMLNISTKEIIHSEVLFDIQDANGTLVKSEKVKQSNDPFKTNITIGDLALGMYFVKIYVENTQYVHRFKKEK